MSLKLQKGIEKKLYNFVDVLDLSICNRCMYNRTKSKKWTNHHQSKLSIEFSKNTNVDDWMVNQWILDADHGLMHCFLVAFFAYMKVLETTPHREILRIIRHGPFEECWFEKLMASCLLHDFARCDGSEDHDKNLKQYFPDLCPETYTHTFPPEEVPLVIADRIELRRYKDWEEWSTSNIARYTASYEKEVAWFYKKIRPAMVKVFEGRYDLWVKHGAEGRTIFSKKRFPQKLDQEIRRQKLNLCSVEIGKLFTFTTQDFQNSNCMLDHSKKWSPRGLVSKKTLDKYGFKCIPCRTHSGRDLKCENGLTKGRDHLCIDKLSLPSHEWVFFYDYENIVSSGYSKLDDVIEHTQGIEENLIIRMLNCTEKIIERIKFLI